MGTDPRIVPFKSFCLDLEIRPRHSVRIPNCSRQPKFLLFFVKVLSHTICCDTKLHTSGFGGLGVLAFGTQVCGFKLGRSRRIFRGKKILSTPSFGGEVKTSVPCRKFAACKRSLKCNVEVGILGKNYRLCLLPT